MATQAGLGVNVRTDQMDEIDQHYASATPPVGSRVHCAERVGSSVSLSAGLDLIMIVCWMTYAVGN